MKTMYTTKLSSLALALLLSACGSSSTSSSSEDLSQNENRDFAGADLTGVDLTAPHTDGSIASATAGHVAYMATCTAGYTNIGSLSGLAVCESPLAKTTVLSTGATCLHGTRVGDYSGPYYQSVCAFDGYLGVGQFAGGACPSGLTDLEPSANGAESCGKVGSEMYWSQNSSCPTGWTNAGSGLGLGHICRRDQAGTLIYLQGSCPSEWETVGEGYCAYASTVLVAAIDNACPSAWTDLGSEGGAAHACLKQ